jgi:hypothetical protein
LIRPGGSRAVIAENLLLKQQLIIHSRARQRAALAIYVCRYSRGSLHSNLVFDSGHKEILKTEWLEFARPLARPGGRL